MRHKRHAGQNALLPSLHLFHSILSKYSLSMHAQHTTDQAAHPGMPPGTFKTGFQQGRSECKAETYSHSYVAGQARRENTAESCFQRAENKKSPRPETDPEDCTRFFILACSPALEGTMVLETYQRIAIVLRRTISNHLPRSRHETILNVLQRIRFRTLSRLRPCI
jgi:hypothetical protein